MAIQKTIIPEGALLRTTLPPTEDIHPGDVFDGRLNDIQSAAVQSGQRLRVVVFQYLRPDGDIFGLDLLEGGLDDILREGVTEMESF